MASKLFHTDNGDDMGEDTVCTSAIGAPYDFGHTTVRFIGTALPMLMLGLSLFFIMR